MKLLILMRHGKALDGSPSGKDFDRLLAPKGERQAESCGRKLLGMKFIPDLILSSEAERALSTARKAAEALGRTDSLRPEPELYEAGPEEIGKIVARIGDECRSAMLVGHNPGLEAFASSLAGNPLPLGKGEAVAFPLAIDRWADFASYRKASKAYPVRPE